LIQKILGCKHGKINKKKNEYPFLYNIMHMKKLNDIKMGVNLIEYCLSYLLEDDVKGQKIIIIIIIIVQEI
jgi:hypothetical protein